ncbi:hypothetical protein NUW54_g3140 [Trametes sanguinea]|uniref:Uncharacterized protein n=1 Tax=Trametes sanguinea TaxID=158606 RepID=A0ACC1Q2T9_9APHY|nr:hypothetical protein NUW54_g3140 [Trametes sanguinea]
MHALRQTSHSAQQLLTPEKEEALCEWIEHLSNEGTPVDKMYHFLARHLDICLRRPSGLAPERARAFNCANVDDYFKKLKAVIKEYSIPWSQVYNMDEKVIQRGGKGNIKRIKYLVPRERHANYKLRSSNFELITIIECICADGTSIQPGFIFAGKEFSRDLFPDIDPRQAAIENNIHLFLLPPHTAHRLQPSDVGVFAALEHAWQIHCNKFFKTSKGQDMDRGEFIHHYLGVCNTVFTADLIRKAWRILHSKPCVLLPCACPTIVPNREPIISRASPALPLHLTSPSRSSHGPRCKPSYTSSRRQITLTSDDSSDDSNGDLDPLDIQQCSVSSRSRDTQSLTVTGELGTPNVLLSAAKCAHLRERARGLRQTEPSPTKPSEKLHQLQRQVSSLEEELTDLYARVWHTEAHAKLAKLHISDLQKQVNYLAQKRQWKQHPLRTQAVCLTAGEGLAMSQQQEAKEAAEQARKEREEAQRQEQCIAMASNPTHSFTGALAWKVKDDLKDIAFALSLSLDSTNAELVRSISQFLHTHPGYAAKPKFASLYIPANGLPMPNSSRICLSKHPRVVTTFKVKTPAHA